MTCQPLHPTTAESGVPTEDLDDETMQTMYTKSEKGRFTHADADKDGDLSKEELKAILFPHHHDHMVDHLVQVSHRAVHMLPWKLRQYLLCSMLTRITCSVSNVTLRPVAMVTRTISPVAMVIHTTMLKLTLKGNSFCVRGLLCFSVVFQSTL